MPLAVVKENASWRIVDGEAVVIHLETTHYYSLNGTGTFIWELLAERPMNVSEIISTVASKYDRSEAEVSDDVHALLQQLKQERLIEER